MLQAFETPAVIVDCKRDIYQGNSRFYQLFNPHKDRSLREIAGNYISALTAEVLKNSSRAVEQAAMTPAGVFRVTISPLKNGMDNKVIPGLLLIFYPMANIKTFQEQMKLTTRELEVALLLAGGHSINITAEALCISETTVRTHRNHIYQKCAINTRAELASHIAVLHTECN